MNFWPKQATQKRLRQAKRVVWSGLVWSGLVVWSSLVWWSGLVWSPRDVCAPLRHSLFSVCVCVSACLCV